MDIQPLYRSTPYVTPDLTAPSAVTSAFGAPSPGRLAWAEIDVDAIAANVAAVAAHIGRGCDVMAVVKANGYGHGLVPSAEAAIRGGAAALGVALLEEALELRESGISLPVVVLGAGLPEQADALVAAGVSQIVSDEAMVDAIARAAARRNRRAAVHIKADTGMGRVGASPADVLRLFDRVKDIPVLDLEGLATHVGWEAPEHQDRTERQIRGFEALIDRLAKRGSVGPLWRHAANSVLTARSPRAHFDMVRVGLLTYGLLPSAVSPDIPGPLGTLQRALSLKARITQVRDFPAGSAVSYGGTHVLRRPSKLAVIPIGYADGYPRALSNGGQVLVAGRRCPVVGAVCMDQLIVDVTGHNLTPGDEVVLIGAQGDDTITPAELAQRSGCILHDIISGLSARLPRVWRGSSGREGRQP